MNQHKVAELEGALLDAAVAKAEGYKYRIADAESSPLARATLFARTREPRADEAVFEPSSYWEDGGPIIERERIELQNHACSDGWWAGIALPPAQDRRGGVCSTGPTPLIAAMRAYVCAKLGDVVDLP